MITSVWLSVVQRDTADHVEAYGTCPEVLSGKTSYYTDEDGNTVEQTDPLVLSAVFEIDAAEWDALTLDDRVARAKSAIESANAEALA